jgi:hypothetical protein
MHVNFMHVRILYSFTAFLASVSAAAVGEIFHPTSLGYFRHISPIETKMDRTRRIFNNNHSGDKVRGTIQPVGNQSVAEFAQ